MTSDGRIRVPRDLDAVTTIGAESRGPIDTAPVERIWESVRRWYNAGMHPAIQVCLRRDGEVILNRSIGHGWGNAPTDPPDAEKTPVTPATPFCVYSAAKAISSTVVHMLVERGAFSLDDRVCDYLPNYTSHGKHRTTIRHVMTHSAGVPIHTGQRPDVTRVDDSEYTRDQLAAMRPVYRPGLLHMYHGLTWGPLIREIVAAATGRSIREILATEILDPLGFRWSNYGVAEADVPLVAPSHPTGKPLPPAMAAAFRRAIGGTLYQMIPYTNTPMYLTSVLPSSNTVSTAEELSRFAELLRRGGELDGVRVLREDTLAAAIAPVRRLRPDIATGGWPMRWGTGYMLGDKRFGPFGRDTAGAFGHTGLVDIAVWTDRARSLSAAIVSSGKPGSNPDPRLYPGVLSTISASIPVIRPRQQPGRSAAR